MPRPRTMHWPPYMVCWRHKACVVLLNLTRVIKKKKKKKKTDGNFHLGVDVTLATTAIATVAPAGPNAFGKGLSFCFTCGRGMYCCAGA